MWTSMAFRDAEAMIGWLKAVGFQERAVYRDDTDPGTVVHAELVWPRGGGVMGSTFALAAGASVLHEPEDQDYGGRTATVRDPEGNVWSMGTYPGE